MRLQISHFSEYRYATPQRRIVQSYRLVPTQNQQQTVCAWKVVVEVDGQEYPPIADYTTAAGDQISHLSFSGAISSLCLLVEGVVETQDNHGIMINPSERISPAVYLRPTELTQHDAHFLQLLDGWALPDDPLAKAHMLSRKVSELVRYQSSSTESDHTAAEALHGGVGVCQDQSHVLIAFARLVHIPARYVVGYLFTDAAGNRHEQSHAWVELYLEGLGWVGFDATNQICVTEQYVRMSSGADAQEAAPIRGIAQSALGSAETLAVTLRIKAAQQ